MRRLLLFLTLLFSINAPARSLTAFINFSSFAVPGEASGFIEVYVLVPGIEPRYQPTDQGGYQASLEMHLVLRQGDSIVSRQDYLLNSKVVPDSNSTPEDIIDLSRFEVSSGKYKLDVLIVDHHDSINYYESTSTIEVSPFSKDKLSLSDPTFMLSVVPSEVPNVFQRHGMEMIPYVLDFFPTSKNDLRFYAELYYSDKAVAEDFLIQYSIEQKSGGRVLVSGFKKAKPGAVIPITGVLDLSNVPSGNYFLAVRIKDRQNELLLEKKRFFFRSNENMVEEVKVDSTLIASSFAANIPFDSLKDYAMALYPLATQTEESTIIGLVKEEDSTALKKYFYLFWERRDPLSPASLWFTYRREVKRVMHNFSTPVLKGYDTDRGRIWLQYGQPNDIRYGREPNAKDYEVWQYYSTEDKQNNVLFVFVNPFNVVNDYQLIHSTAQGEVFNERWKMEIYNTFADPNGAQDIDMTNPNRSSFGTRSDQILEDF